MNFESLQKPATGACLNPKQTNRQINNYLLSKKPSSQNLCFLAVLSVSGLSCIWRLMTSLAAPKPLSSYALTLRYHGNRVGGTNTSGWLGGRLTSTNQNASEPWPSGTHSFLLKYPPYSCQHAAFSPFVACTEGCAGCIARLTFSSFPLEDHAVLTAVWPVNKIVTD
jgi:hypothetical protein